MTPTIWAYFLGMALGVRHALEPDHLIAVSTLIVETKSTRAGAALGVIWGLGHSLSLLAVGILLALAHQTLPARTGQLFELAVSVLFVLFGARAVSLAFVLAKRAREGAPDSRRPESIPRPAPRRSQAAMRSMVVGLVHGLAGSGGLTALAVAELPTTGARLTYIAVFGGGSAVGMAALSGFVGAPLSRMARRPLLTAAVSFVVGWVSIICGAVWGLPLLLRLY